MADTKNSSQRATVAFYLPLTSSQFRDYFHPKDGDDTFIWKFSSNKETNGGIPEQGILHSHRHENFKETNKLRGP
jgi:hypothetical protein